MNYGYFLLLVFFVVSVVSDGTQVDETRKKNALAELRNLNSKCAPDSMRCWFKLTKASREKCKEESLEFKKTLMKRVRQYWLDDGYICPDEGQCVNGYGHFKIDSFNDPERLPCDEQAFAPPKHTDEEIDAMYRTLLSLYNEYKSCKGGKECGDALAAKIKYAEDEDMIPPSCEKNGYGWYVFYTGMDEVQCPCIYTDPKATSSATTTSTTATDTSKTK